MSHSVFSARSARSPGRNGTTAVELAFVLPVFFAFVFGLFEIGRLGMMVNLLSGSSRSAARFGATEGITTAEANERALEMMSSVIDPSLVTVAVKDASVFDGPGPYPSTAEDFNSLPTTELSETEPREAFLVQTTVSYNDIALVPFPFMDGVILHGRSIMRHE